MDELNQLEISEETPERATTPPNQHGSPAKIAPTPNREVATPFPTEVCTTQGTEKLILHLLEAEPSLETIQIMNDLWSMW